MYHYKSNTGVSIQVESIDEFLDLLESDDSVEYIEPLDFNDDLDQVS